MQETTKKACYVVLYSTNCKADVKAFELSKSAVDYIKTKAQEAQKKMIKKGYRPETTSDHLFTQISAPETSEYHYWRLFYSEIE